MGVAVVPCDCEVEVRAWAGPGASCDQPGAPCASGEGPSDWVGVAWAWLPWGRLEEAWRLGRAQEGEGHQLKSAYHLQEEKINLDRYQLEL